MKLFGQHLQIYWHSILARCQHRLNTSAVEHQTSSRSSIAEPTASVTMSTSSLKIKAPFPGISATKARLDDGPNGWVVVNDKDRDHLYVHCPYKGHFRKPPTITVSRWDHQERTGPGKRIPSVATDRYRTRSSEMSKSSPCQMTSKADATPHQESLLLLRSTPLAVFIRTTSAAG
jgi:hypothetical protein